MSEIKLSHFSRENANFPIFPVKMGKLSLFQHEAFCHQLLIVLQTVTNNYISIIENCSLQREA